MLVEIQLVEISRSNEVTVIVVQEKEGPRRFPIFIGPREAEALEMSIHNFESPRPLTHDLILNIIRDLGGTLTRVIIDKLEDDTFFGKLDVRKADNATVWIDSRPSDAVVIASKTNVPLYCEVAILDRIGQAYDEDEDEA